MNTRIVVYNNRQNKGGKILREFCSTVNALIIVSLQEGFNMRSSIQAAVILFLLLYPQCPSQAAGMTQQCFLNSHEQKRSYWLYIPSSYKQGVRFPLIMMLHGGGGTGKAAMAETSWTVTAEKHGFIVAFPDALPRDPGKPSSFRNNPQTWNDGSGRFPGKKNVDDVAFLKHMAEQVSSNYGIDRSRIFVTGFSNGASMAFRAAAELSSIFAAAAPVAGALWSGSIKLERPVSLIYITGTGDSLNPMQGGTPTLANGKAIRGLTGKPKPPVCEHIEKWKRALGIDGEGSETVHQNGVKALSYHNDKGEILFYTLQGHGHIWPGGNTVLPESMVGKDTGAIKANEVIWDFFARHPRKAAGER